MVYFTSDLHFGHEKLCRGLRGMSAEESDKLIIENWNKIITKHDTVYVLGDITMEKHKNIEEYIKQLKGDIVIIGGNHDKRKCCKEYQRLGIQVLGCMEYKGFICSHIPLHPDCVAECRGNIHGHIHLKGDIEGYGPYEPPKPLEGRYYNVCCELHDYKPVPFEEIVKYFEEKGY